MLKGVAARVAIAVTVAATAGYLLVGRVSAAPTFGTTFTVVESGEGTYQDEATKAPPDFSQPTPPGDTVVFKADLLQGGTTVGQARGACTSVFDTQYECNVVFSIVTQGTLQLQIAFDLANPQGDYVITGGTGRFAGRHGWAHFTTLSNGDEVHTFHLSDTDR